MPAGYGNLMCSRVNNKYLDTLALDFQLALHNNMLLAVCKVLIAMSSDHRSTYKIDADLDLDQQAGSKTDAIPEVGPSAV